MFHFIKYLLLAVFLFVFLNLFRSNMDVMVSLKFDVPLLANWSSIPIGVTYLLLIAFCVGIVFSAFVGAFRMSDVRAQKKELKKLKQDLQEIEKSRPGSSLSSASFKKENDIPSLLS